MSHRSNAEQAARVAHQRLDALAQGVEARRFPGILSVLSALLEAIEEMLKDQPQNV